MAQTDINKTGISDYTGTITNYSVDQSTTDSPEGDEYEYMCTRAPEYLGYYRKVPELKIAIDTIATWTVGKGYTSPSPLTELALSVIKGTGNETFNSILESLIRDMHIYGDSYAEIIREDGRLINLKKLDPYKMKIIYTKKGIIKEYVYSKGGTEVTKQPEEILHFSNDKVSDEVHGISIIEAVEWIILARNEAMEDYKKMLHRNIYPVRIWHLDTDVDSEISTFKAKVAQSKYKGEDIFIPKGTVDTELASLPDNSSIDPKSWIAVLNQYFYQEVGVPQIVIGGSQELTQTAAQITYLSFEQNVEERQLYIEEQVLSQLNLEIDLTFPASLQNNVLSDIAKDGTQQQNTNQPSKLQPPMMRQEAQ